MGRMLRLKSFDELPPSCRERVREMFAKGGVTARGTQKGGGVWEPPKETKEEKPPSASLTLYWQIAKAKLPRPIREYHFDQQGTDGRGWKFDLAWPSLMIAVEVDGMVHRIKGRYKADIPRSQAAFMAGWRVLRVSPTDVENGRALELIRQSVGVLEAEGLSPLQRVFRRMEMAQDGLQDPP